MMKDNWFFKTVRGMGWLTLRLGPMTAFILFLCGQQRLAFMLLCGWAMTVTNILTIRPPVPRLWKEG